MLRTFKELREDYAAFKKEASERVRVTIELAKTEHWSGEMLAASFQNQLRNLLGNRKSLRAPENLRLTSLWYAAVYRVTGVRYRDLFAAQDATFLCELAKTKAEAADPEPLWKRALEARKSA